MPNDTPDWFGEAQTQLDQVVLAPGATGINAGYTLRPGTHALGAMVWSSPAGAVGAATMTVTGHNSGTVWIALGAVITWDFAIIPSAADTTLDVAYRSDPFTSVRFALVEVPLGLVHRITQPPGTFLSMLDFPGASSADVILTATGAWTQLLSQQLKRKALVVANNTTTPAYLGVSAAQVNVPLAANERVLLGQPWAGVQAVYGYLEGATKGQWTAIAAGLHLTEVT